MYAKVLAYAGEHRRYTAMAIACMLVGLTANTLQKIRNENRISFCRCRFFIMLLLKFIAAL